MPGDAPPVRWPSRLAVALLTAVATGGVPPLLVDGGLNAGYPIGGAITGLFWWWLYPVLMRQQHTARRRKAEADAEAADPDLAPTADERARRLARRRWSAAGYLALGVNLQAITPVFVVALMRIVAPGWPFLVAAVGTIALPLVGSCLAAVRATRREWAPAPFSPAPLRRFLLVTTALSSLGWAGLALLLELPLAALLSALLSVAGLAGYLLAWRRWRQIAA